MTARGPTVAVTTTAGSPTKGDVHLGGTSVKVDISFSEPVAGLEISDIKLTNATVAKFLSGPSKLQGSGSSYTLFIEPIADGTVRVEVPAGAAKDADSNANAAATPLSFVYDGTAPNITLTGPSGAQSGPFDVAVTVSENVTGLDVSAFEIKNGTATLTGSGKDYTLSIVPNGVLAGGRHHLQQS